jgi:hypothetical protein
MVKKHLQENPFTSGTSRLLKLVAFVLKGTIIWADEKVTRLSPACRNPQDGQAGNRVMSLTQQWGGCYVTDYVSALQLSTSVEVKAQ